MVSNFVEIYHWHCIPEFISLFFQQIPAMQKEPSINFLDLTNILSFLTLTNIIIFFGIFGILLNRSNFLISMLFIEIMYVGFFLSFALISYFFKIPTGQIYALIILIVAACESAIGLGILLLIFLSETSLDFSKFTELRG